MVVSFLKDDKAVGNFLLILFSMSGLLFVYYLVFVIKPPFAEIKDLVFLIVGTISGRITKNKR